MIELFATSIITLSSALLFVYWFRYTCLLILSTKTARDYASDFAESNALNVLKVQAELPSASSADLERLHKSLERDFEVLRHLFRNCNGGQELEDRMMSMYYRLMDTCYALTRGFSERWARTALESMTEVVAHFANALGERAEMTAAA
jgi:hypothetical protein